MTPKEISEWIDPDIRGRLGLLAESLYGHPVKPGNTPVDSIIAAVERNWLDWDPNNQKFIDVVIAVLKETDPKTVTMPTPDKWKELFNQSQQSPELKDVLLRKLGITITGPAASGITGPAASGSTGITGPASGSTGITGPASGSTGIPVGPPLTSLQVAQPGKYPPTGFPEGAGRFRIHFNRGTVVEAVAVLKSADPRSITTYYATLRQLAQPKMSYRRGGSRNYNKKGRPSAFAKFQGKYCYWFGDIITFRTDNVKMVEILP